MRSMPPPPRSAPMTKAAPLPVAKDLDADRAVVEHVGSRIAGKLGRRAGEPGRRRARILRRSRTTTAPAAAAESAMTPA